MKIEKKILILALISFTVVSVIFADGDPIFNQRYVGEFSEVIISESAVTYINKAGIPGIPEEITVSPYSVVEKDNVPFVVDAEGSIKFLVLQNDELQKLYIQDFRGNIANGVAEEIYRPRAEDFVTPWDLTASSFLIEGETEYLPENLSRIRLNEPWVEGVPGNGIGEWIEFSMGPFEGFYLFNGFISFDKPDLYTRNSRVKTFRVYDLTAGDNWVIELDDTPSPQFFSLEGRQRHKIRLVIEVVYEGTQYEDTCLAGILLRRRF
ncbi:NADase-type glycan-binding domain-containing protein [Salinispira pacifica]|uniref:NAD glycohydrolase translocation F5/8 type C domain-containing protein n=1 Tax=Salinispira pacifica TaxID=1307761 RepID=V5WH39_9SPIO|nr:hypothetical protein [Salinispira pacifica]AHC14874.1 hypothetical protein L21SP2_1477 [Salinispira pacifica]